VISSYEFYDSFKDGINQANWHNNGWNWDDERTHSIKSSGNGNSSISLDVPYPCVVSFSGMRKFPGSKLIFQDNNVPLCSISNPMTYGWEPRKQAIGENYSIITEDYMNELEWIGVKNDYLDDVRIHALPFIRFREVKATPNISTSYDEITYSAEIESSITDFNLELVVLPPDANSSQEKSLGVIAYKGDPLKWGPIKLNCTKCGLGRFWFKIGAPFNKISKIYFGPDIKAFMFNPRYYNCSKVNGRNRCQYCTDVIANTNVTIELSGRNNDSTYWIPLGNRTVIGAGKRQPSICFDSDQWDSFEFDVWH
jgi:hypothetical protein